MYLPLYPKVYLYINPALPFYFYTQGTLVCPLVIKILGNV